MTDGKRVYDDGKMFLRKLQRFLNKQVDLSSGQKSFNRITNDILDVQNYGFPL